ncbi:hypothetical protein [Niveispirillum sp. BGYR6]|uniref:hypothetical protein n=1 Tax=Niveispirillum sp. BGYR6 TaxID=2971249 RepID=UPI0022B957F8|nr:hypothetical protein [Niveispirillum sp. BGYR6]MDG5494435.1 hypothetical protein [Niveispirillum sp. BGYR6]
MAFWQQDGDVLFADERHQREHARLLAQDYKALLPCTTAAVLEFGPGRADTAPLIAPHCARLILS